VLRICARSAEEQAVCARLISLPPLDRSCAADDSTCVSYSCVLINSPVRRHVRVTATVRPLSHATTRSAAA